MAAEYGLSVDGDRAIEPQDIPKAKIECSFQVDPDRLSHGVRFARHDVGLQE
jgi:hypothetical protein